MLKWFVAFVLVSCSPSLAAAQTSAFQPEVRALAEYSTLRREFREPETRAGLVKALQAYCSALDLAYPRNSPSEEAWLSREMMSGNDSERILRSIGSPEMGRRIAANFLETCTSFTRQYLEFPDQRTLSLFVLIEATSKFRNDAEFHARKNGVDPDKWGFILLNGTIGALSAAGMFETGKVIDASAR